MHEPGRVLLLKPLKCDHSDYVGLKCIEARMSFSNKVGSRSCQVCRVCHSNEESSLHLVHTLLNATPGTRTIPWQRIKITDGTFNTGEKNKKMIKTLERKKNYKHTPLILGYTWKRCRISSMKNKDIRTRAWPLYADLKKVELIWSEGLGCRLCQFRLYWSLH